MRHLDKPADKPAEKPAEKPADKPAEKPAEKPAAKAAEKTAAKPAEKTMTALESRLFGDEDIKEWDFVAVQGLKRDPKREEQLHQWG